jgi:hypothetical protein
MHGRICPDKGLKPPDVLQRQTLSFPPNWARQTTAAKAKEIEKSIAIDAEEATLWPAPSTCEHLW